MASYFNEEFETLPRPALEALQLKRLQQVVERVYCCVPFYKASFDRAACRSRPNRTCAIPTPTGSLQRRWRR